MGKGSAPKAPDPVQTANAQGQMNQAAWEQQNVGSKVNTTNPYGSSTWSRNADGTWSNNQTYSPEQQGLFDAKQNTQLGIAGALPDALQQFLAMFQTGGPDYSKLNPLQNSVNAAHFNPTQNATVDVTKLAQNKTIGPDGLPTYSNLDGNNYQLGQVKAGDINRGSLDIGVDGYDKVAAPNAQIRDWASLIMPAFAGMNDKLANMDPWAYDREGADAMYRENTRYLQPEQESTRKMMEGRLAEQGFVPGTPAYDSAMRQYMDTNNRAYASAQDRATLAGRQFGDQAFDNQAGVLNSSIANLLSGGSFGMNNDIARSKEGLDIANFQSGENRFAANNSLDMGKFQQGLQAQDFSQQKTLSDIERQGGLDANAVIAQQFGLDKGVSEFNNANAQQGFQDLMKQLGFDNTALNNDITNAEKVYNYNLSANNANNAAGQNAVNAGNAADLAAGNFNNNALDQGRTYAMEDYMQPFMQLMSMLGMVNPGEAPGATTTQTGNLAAGDLQGATDNKYAADVNGYNAKLGTQAQLFGTLAKLFMPSDIRLKENITRIGTSPKGYPWYSFNYIGDKTPREGVMAQDVLPHDPSAVDVHNGFYRVDYLKV